MTSDALRDALKRGLDFHKSARLNEAVTWYRAALAIVAVSVIAFLTGLSSPEDRIRELVFLNGFFVAMFAGSAVLLLEAARGESRSAAN